MAGEAGLSSRTYGIQGRGGGRMEGVNSMHKGTKSVAELGLLNLLLNPTL